MSVPYLGKRNPGGLTAANPGDTLFFPFAAFNDSGDSEAVSGFAVTDIEVFRDGQPTARATDSGYSLISDTGQMGDRVGLNRFSIQVFNTSDDTGFYQSGSWYQVAVDAVTIDGKTVRFWAGQFEIGFPQVDVRRLVGDTGAANQLQQAFATVPTYRQHVDLRAVLGDTGAAHLDGGRLGVAATVALDTGQINRAVWVADASRTLTGFQFDTGIWASASRTLTAGTNIALAKGTGITGFNDPSAAENAAAVWAAGARTLTSFAFDTGIWASPSRTLTAISDTGLNERLAAIEERTGRLQFDTGNWAMVDIRKVNNVRVIGAGDTGGNNRWNPGT
jgi:hypothetical protein